jgi:hypothetical protein
MPIPLVFVAVGVAAALAASGGGSHAAPGGGGGGGGTTPNPSPGPSPTPSPNPAPLDPVYNNGGDNGGGSTAPYVNPDGTAVFPNNDDDQDLGPSVDSTNGGTDLGGAAVAQGTNADDDSWFSTGAGLSQRQSHHAMRVGQLAPADYPMSPPTGSEWVWCAQIGAWVPPYPGHSRGVPVPAGLPALRPLNY